MRDADHSWQLEQRQLEQDKLMQEITRHQAADRFSLDEGVRPIELAHGAHRRFARHQPSEQRRLMNFVLSNSTWRSGVLTPTFRRPFGRLAQTTAAAAGENGGGTLNSLAVVGFQGGGLFCLRRSYDFSRQSGAGEAITLESDKSELASAYGRLGREDYQLKKYANSLIDLYRDSLLRDAFKCITPVPGPQFHREGF